MTTPKPKTLTAAELAELRKWAHRNVVMEARHLVTCLDHIAALESDNARLREALEWYADETNWDDGVPFHLVVNSEPHFANLDDVSENDNGRVARIALSKDGGRE